MESPDIIRGRVHAPYFIFVRQWVLSDEELLMRLGLGSYRRLDCFDDGCGLGLWMTNDAEWTHVIDNWAYDLWHMQGMPERIAGLVVDHDVFTCSVGDTDYTYAFAYHAHGRLVRQRVVDLVCERWPHTYVLAKDFGELLPIESNVTAEDDDLTRLLLIASSLGIETDAQKLRFRFYEIDDELRHPLGE